LHFNIRRYNLNLTAKFSRLEVKFNTIASSDNIISPKNSSHKILSVADIESIPTPISTDWHLGPSSASEKSNYKPKRINGYLLLFWPTIDDMINSKKYVDYIFSNNGENICRILFTPNPKYNQGLEIYRTLCKKADEKLYIIDAEMWSSWIVDSSEALNRGPKASRELRKGFLDLVERHVEIWIDDIAETMTGKRWLVRWLGDVVSDEMLDTRSSLADVERRMERRTSAESHTDEELAKFKRVAGFIKVAVSALGEATDKKSYPDVEQLLGRRIPQELATFVLNPGTV
jgi:hypothetical protein